MACPDWCWELSDALLAVSGIAALLIPSGVYGSYWWVPLAVYAGTVALPSLVEWVGGAWLSLMCELERRGWL